MVTFKTVSVISSRLERRTATGYFINEVGRNVLETVHFCCLTFHRTHLLHSRSDLSVPVEPDFSEGGFSRGFQVFMNDKPYFIKLGEPQSDSTIVDEEAFRKQIRAKETLAEHLHVIEMMKEGVFTDAPPCLVRPIKVGTFQSPESDNHALIPAILYEVLPDEPIHSLKNGFRLKTVFSLTEIQAVITAVLPGVIHLHQHGFSHRDIGPHNMTRTRLYDYGKAAKIEDGPGENLFLYLPYSPPERETSETYTDNFNETLDLWQLGCTAFQLAMGGYPFEIDGDTPKPETIRRSLLLAEKGEVKTTKEGVYNLLVTNRLSSFKKKLTFQNCPELDLFCDFLACALQPNPGKRQKAMSLFSHPFLTTTLKDNLILADLEFSVSRFNIKAGFQSYISFNQTWSKRIDSEFESTSEV